MARILVGEPVAEIRLLLDLQLRRLGHEPVHVDGKRGVASGDADAALLEPAAPRLLALARTLRRQRPGLPLVFVSTESPTAQTRALEPVRHIVKPFERRQLAEAVEAALRSGESHDSHT